MRISVISLVMILVSNSTPLLCLSFPAEQFLPYSSIQWLSGEGNGYLLVWPQNPTQWSDGRFSLQDNRQILLFSTTGALLGNVYQRGEGPGAFRGSITHTVCASRLWTVLDYAAARVILMGENGKYRSQWDLPSSPDGVVTLAPQALCGWWVNAPLSSRKRECWDLCEARPGQTLRLIYRQYRPLVYPPPAREPLYANPLFACRVGERIWLVDTALYSLHSVSFSGGKAKAARATQDMGPPTPPLESWVTGLSGGPPDHLWVTTNLRKDDQRACDLWHTGEESHLVMRLWIPWHWHFMGESSGCLFVWEPESETCPEGRLGRIPGWNREPRNLSAPSSVPSSESVNHAERSYGTTASLLRSFS